MRPSTKKRILVTTGRLSALRFFTNNKPVHHNLLCFLLPDAGGKLPFKQQNPYENRQPSSPRPDRVAHNHVEAGSFMAGTAWSRAACHWSCAASSCIRCRGEEMGCRGCAPGRKDPCHDRAAAPKTGRCDLNLPYKLLTLPGNIKWRMLSDELCL